MRFDEIARDLVHTASRLLRGRIVNIMDTSGVIVASTDAERIGTTHEGAREVVRTGRPVAIEKSDVPRYPGAREGYNLPVLSDNRLTAVVGVYGNPEEVRDIYFAGLHGAVLPPEGDRAAEPHIGRPARGLYPDFDEPFGGRRRTACGARWRARP